MLRLIKYIKRHLLHAILCLHTIFKGSYRAVITILKGKTFSVEYNMEKDIIVLGNGPSLAELDLEQISKKYKIACVNCFATRNEKFPLIRPSFYFLFDPLFFDRNDSKYSSRQKEIEKLMLIFEDVDWEMGLVIPQGRSLNINNPNITISHIATESINDDRCISFQYMLYRHNLVTCGMQNVMCAVLHYFILKHYRTIYLSGVDMSEFKGFSVDERNHVLMTFEHADGKEKADLTEANYIPIGGFGKYLGYYSKMLVQICRLSEFAKTENVNIINLSTKSFIDVFKKKHWQEII